MNEFTVAGQGAEDNHLSDEIPCVLCNERLSKSELEAHISAEHLDYFPYSCGHCGHHMPSEDLAHFHAQRRAHLPLKIREFLNVAKEADLRLTVQRCLAGVGYPVVIPEDSLQNKQHHEHSPTISASVNDQPETSFQSRSNILKIEINDDSREDENSVTGGSPGAIFNSKSSSVAVDTSPEKFQGDVGQEVFQQSIQLEEESNESDIPHEGTPKSKADFCSEVDGVSALRAVSTVLEAEDLGRTKTHSFNPNRFGYSSADRNSPGDLPKKRTYKKRKWGSPSTRKSNRLSTPIQATVEDVDKVVIKQGETNSHGAEKEKALGSLEDEVKEEELQPNSEVSKSSSPLRKQRLQIPHPSDFDFDSDGDSKGTGKHLRVKRAKRDLSKTSDVSDFDSDDCTLRKGRKPNSLPDKKQSLLTNVFDFDSDDGMKLQLKKGKRDKRKNFVDKPTRVDHRVPAKTEEKDSKAAESLMGPEASMETEETADSKMKEEKSPERLAETDSISSSKGNRKACNLCHTMVSEGKLESHVKSHMEGRPMVRCKHCIYQGGSVQSVKIHIGRRHPGCDVKVGYIDISDLGRTVAGMTEICFPNDSAPIVGTDNPKLTTPEVPEDTTSTKKCNICLHEVNEKDVQAHVAKHVQMRPLAGCAYCNFKGKTTSSVRVHISWRHASRSKILGMGVRDLSDKGATNESMRQLCFGKKEQEVTFEDPALVSKAMKICRPYARRATKSLSAKPMSFGSKEGAGSEETGGKNKGTKQRMEKDIFKESGKQPYKQVRKHLNCAECGQQVLDALISGHIFMNHIKRENAVQCGYCDFGSTYLMRPVKQHLAEKHIALSTKIVDRRHQMHPEYVEWRKKCFPGAGTHSIGPKRPSSDNSETLEQSALQVATKKIVVSLTDMNIKDKSKDERVMSPSGEGESAVSNDNPKYKPARKHCSKCDETVCDMWIMRHVWKHLEQEGKPKFECGAVDCGYQTYLLKTLDTHCMQQHNSTGASDVGYVDHDQDLKRDFEMMWNECFYEADGKTIEKKKYKHQKMKSTPVKPYIRVEEDQEEAEPHLENPLSAEKYPQELDDDQDGSAFSLLLANALGHHQSNSQEGKAKSPQLFPAGSSSSSIAIEKVEKRGSPPPQPNRIRVINCVSSSGELDAWCNKCCCTVNKSEIETHVWYAHLGGILPFRCPRCQNSFMTMDQIETHWTASHKNGHLGSSQQSTSGAQEALEVIENPNARSRFNEVIGECFPDMVEFAST